MLEEGYFSRCKIRQPENESSPGGLCETRKALETQVAVFFLFFYKRLDSKLFRLCRPCCLCCNYSTLSLHHESNHRQHINRQMWLCSRKTILRTLKFEFLGHEIIFLLIIFPNFIKCKTYFQFISCIEKKAGNQI